MPKKRRKLNKDLEAEITKAFKKVEFIQAVINDIEDGISYMQSDNIERYSDKALKIINSADKKIMLGTINELEKISLWQAITIEGVIKSEIKKHNLKMFDIAAPIRASITGKTFSPSIFLVLEKLGKKVSIERLKKNFD